MTGKRTTWMSATTLGGVLLLALSGCSGDTHLAYGGVGSAGTSGSGSGTGTSGDGSGGDGSAGGTGSSSTGGTGGSGASGGTGGTGGGGTTVASGSQGSLGTALTQAGPVLVTAGNVALGLAGATDGATTQLASAVPLTAPITGTVTKVLTDTGQLLVNVGNGRTLLLDGAQGVVGDVLTINAGNQAVTSATGGANGLVGLGVATANQPVGTLATVGVLDPGQVASATVNGVANVSVVNVTGAHGGLSNQLLNVAVADHQLLGSGNPAVINASLLSGVNGAGGATGLLTPVTSTVKTLTGGLPSAGTTTGVGAVLTPVTSTVGTTVNTLTGTTLTGSASASGSANAGGVLKPVSSLTGKSGGILTPVTTSVNNLTSGLTAR